METVTTRLRCNTSHYHLVLLCIHTLHPLEFSIHGPCGCHMQTKHPKQSIYRMCIFLLFMQSPVVLSPTKHKFSNKVVEEFKVATGKHETKYGMLLSYELVHSQNRMFTSPAVGSSHDISSFLLTGVCNYDWKM